MRVEFLGLSTRAGGSRLSVHHEPAGVSRGAVVAIHPFAEEMNKSRRMLALGARALAQAGFGVIQLDLFGCGDSDGELADARWDDWLDDIQAAVDVVSGINSGPLWLWGTRAGCLLAADWMRSRSVDAHCLFWQPQLQGRQVLAQFLRLRMASQLQDGGSKGITDALHEQLRSGEAVDVAGYRLGPGIALGMAASLLTPPGHSVAQQRRLEWFEVSTREPATLLPASTKTIAEWQQSGYLTGVHVVSGPRFWQTLEIEDAPSLVEATVAALLTAPSA